MSGEDTADCELDSLRSAYFHSQCPFSERLEMTKTEYYQELLQFSLCNLMLYPYHLCGDFPDDVLSAPQVYYNEMIVALIVYGMGYDTLPTFCAADVAQTIGVDREEFERRFDIVNRRFILRNLFTRIDFCARRLTDLKKLQMPNRDWTHYQLIRRESTDIDLVTQLDLIDFYRTDGLVPASMIKSDRARCFYAAQHLVPMISVERGAKLDQVTHIIPRCNSDALYERVLRAIVTRFSKSAVAGEIVDALASEFSSEEVLNGISLLIRLGVFEQRKPIIDYHVRTAVLLKQEFIQALTRVSDAFSGLLNNGVVECAELKSRDLQDQCETCRTMSLLVNSIGTPANVVFCDIGHLWKPDSLANIVSARLNYDVVVMASEQYPKLWRTPVIGSPCDSTNWWLWPCFIQSKGNSFEWHVYRKGESLAGLHAKFSRHPYVRLYTPCKAVVCRPSQASEHVQDAPVAVIAYPSDKMETIPFPSCASLSVDSAFLLSETFGYVECVRAGDTRCVVNIAYGVPTDSYQLCSSVIEAACSARPLTKQRLDALRPRLGRLADQFLGFCRQYL